MGISPWTLAGLAAGGAAAILLYLFHAKKLRRVIQPAIVPHAHVFTRVAGQFCRAYRQRYAAVYDAGLLQIGLGFSPFHAGLMMIPMVLGSMGMKRIVVQIVNRFGYRRVLVATTLGLALVSLLFMSVALLGWYYLLPLVLLLQGMVNSARFSSMNTLTLKDLPDTLASSGNSLLSMIMQLSMSIGVTIAGMLLGMFGQQHIGIDSSATHHVFMYTGYVWRLLSRYRR